MKEKFRGDLKVIFPVRPNITNYQQYAFNERMKSAGLDRSGILVFELENSHYWGRNLKSIFVPKTAVIDNLLDVDLVDADPTVIEEVSYWVRI